MKLFLQIFLLCFIQHAFSDVDKNDDENTMKPIVYTEEGFNDNIAVRSHFVMFYAPWCGHCQRLKPVWDELAKHIQQDDSVELAVAKVDCTVETKLCSDQGVLGYPTLKLFQPEKEAVRHKGARDLSSLIAFIKNTLNSADEEQVVHAEGLFDLTSDNFESHIETSRHFVMFYAPWCGHCKRLEPTWAELAKLHEPKDENQNDVKIARIDCTKHRDVCSQHKVRGYPTLLWFEDGKMIAKYQESRQLDALEKFIKKMINPEAQETESEEESPEGLHDLTGDSFLPHISSGAHFIKFYAPWCGHCKRLEPTWLELAKSRSESDDSGAVKIGRVDCTKHQKICSDYGVRGYPSLLWFNDGVKVKVYQGSRDIASLQRFIDEQLNPDETDQKPEEAEKPKLEQEAVDAEETEDTDTDGPVLDLKSKNFDFSTAIDVTFVMFYAPWCGFCKRLTPTWEELAVQDFTSLNQEVKVARVDCTKYSDLCHTYKVQGYPTLILFKDGEELAQYSGSRTLDDLKKFIFDTVAAQPVFLDEKDEL